MAFNIDDTQPSAVTLGKKGSTIDYSGGDVSLGSTVKAVFVCVAGNVVYRPRGEASGSITITGAPVGLYLPHVPGLIVASGSTATLCTVED